VEAMDSGFQKIHPDITEFCPTLLLNGFISTFCVGRGGNTENKNTMFEFFFSNFYRNFIQFNQ
jgi:hypothetical protein